MIIFLFLGRSSVEVKILEKKFLMIYKDYKGLLNAINNKSYDEVHAFLKKYSIIVDDCDKFMKTLEDPLLIQAMNSLSTINHNLYEMAHEVLT